MKYISRTLYIYYEIFGIGQLIRKHQRLNVFKIRIKKATKIQPQNIIFGIRQLIRKYQRLNFLKFEQKILTRSSK